VPDLFLRCITGCRFRQPLGLRPWKLLGVAEDASDRSDPFARNQGTAALVKVFRRRPSQTFPHGRGRRLKTSKGRNRGKGTYEAVPARLLWGFGRGRATAELSREGRLSNEDGERGRGRCVLVMSGPV
jgi:hypothetical protein